MHYEGVPDAIVIDETGLTGNYDFMLQSSQRLSSALLTEWRRPWIRCHVGFAPVISEPSAGSARRRSPAAVST
jgi:hypothetical protein